MTTSLLRETLEETEQTTRQKAANCAIRSQISVEGFLKITKETASLTEKEGMKKRSVCVCVKRYSLPTKRKQRMTLWQ